MIEELFYFTEKGSYRIRLFLRKQFPSSRDAQLIDVEYNAKLHSVPGKSVPT